MGVCYGTPDFPTPSFTGRLRSGMKLTISSSSSSAASNDQVIGDREILADSSLTVFSLAELKVATNNFRANALLGEGGFGYVYKGMLQAKQQSGKTKTIIAVKRLNKEAFQGIREWLAEVEILGKLSHPNLVKLLGYCRQDEDLALVYEFMPKGSLNNHLFRKGSTAHLPWDVRLKIMVGAARGLAFLHSSCNMIYRDFKTSNILLDGSYTAKLTDFGLVRSGPAEGESHVSTQIVGTFGYAAPEYIATGHLYVKSDVYSFGIVLLEIITGLSVIDRSRPAGRRNLLDWVKPFLSNKRKLKTIVDARLEGSYTIHSASQIAQLALRCLQLNHSERPPMTEVVESLESIEAASASTMPGDA